MPHFKFNGINIYYEEIGDGEPLLFINGLAGDTHQWDMAAPYLKASFKMILYDMRCAGQSGRPGEAFTVSDLADEAAALAEHIGYNRLHVLGFSMGGTVAIELALKRPEIFKSMILLSTCTSILGSAFPPSEKCLEILHRTDVSPELLGEVYEIIFGPEFKKKNLKDAYVKMRLDMGPAAQPADAYLSQLTAAETHRQTKDISKIKVPALIITGDSDLVIDPRNSKWMHERIKGSKLFVLKDAGHMIPLEVPKRLSEILNTTQDN